ncbi:MAG TPA: hypothetical protein VFR90_02690 [Methylibium sp.]|uniref:hypothetical protein n=1 Tax=Methylibium sp. TaxID=2067992 RepID=UPI002DBDDAE9|nr:hypothetical protein [Methylibium sp.]HEU4458010.1 hypothetical protein [Methylibium sp.]
MKLLARFPQILVGGRRAAGNASEVVQRSAFWPTTRNHEETLNHPLGRPVGPLPPAQRALVERPRNDWASTVAAWRSTTGLGSREDRT